MKESQLEEGRPEHGPEKDIIKVAEPGKCKRPKLFLQGFKSSS